MTKVMDLGFLHSRTEEIFVASHCPNAISFPPPTTFSLSLFLSLILSQALVRSSYMSSPLKSNLLISYLWIEQSPQLFWPMCYSQMVILLLNQLETNILAHRSSSEVQIQMLCSFWKACTYTYAQSCTRHNTSLSPVSLAHPLSSSPPSSTSSSLDFSLLCFPSLQVTGHIPQYATHTHTHIHTHTRNPFMNIPYRGKFSWGANFHYFRD